MAQKKSILPAINEKFRHGSAVIAWILLALPALFATAGVLLIRENFQHLRSARVRSAVEQAMSTQDLVVDLALNLKQADLLAAQAAQGNLPSRSVLDSLLDRCAVLTDRIATVAENSGFDRGKLRLFRKLTASRIASIKSRARSGREMDRFKFGYARTDSLQALLAVLDSVMRTEAIRAAQKAAWEPADQLFSLFFVELPVAVFTLLFYIFIFKQYRRRRNAEQQFERFFEFGPEGQFIMSSDGKLLKVNRTLALLYGFDSPEEFLQAIQEKGEALFPDRETFSKFLEAVHFNGVVHGVEIDVDPLSGETLSLMLSAQLLKIKSKKDVHIIGQVLDITHRRSMEKRLQLLSQAVEQSSDGVIITDASWTILFVNRAFEKMSGYPRSQLIGAQPTILRSEAHPEEFYEELNEQLLEGKPARRIFKNRRANGELYLQDTVIAPVKNEQGEIIHFIASARDVTEEKQKEEALKRSEMLYRTLFEMASDAILLYSPERRKIIAANDAAEKISGYSPDELLRKSVEDLIGAGDFDLLEREWQKQISEEGDFRLQLHARHRDGHDIVLDLVGTPVELDGELCYQVIARDVTERERMMAELEEAEKRYKRLFDADLTADCVISSEGAILLSNPAFEELFGSCDRRNIREYFASDEEWDRLLDLIYREKRLANQELDMLDANGNLVPVVANLVLQFNPKSGTTEIIAYFFDLRERRKLEEQLIQSQKLEAIGRLAGGIAHDFNNLLTIILGYSGFALDALDEDSPLYHDIAEIREAGLKASSLTAQLLAFSRKQIVHPRPVNLNDAVRSMHKMLSRLLSDDITLKIILEDNLPYVLMDPGQIDQVLVNLAVNAHDAMPNGGELVFATKRVELGDRQAKKIPGLKPGAYVMLAVKDTGTGIDPETLSRIFDPFFTTKEAGHGTGLGLSTVYGIVTQSGGTIAVDSTPGKGTVFRIYLPEMDENAYVGREPKRQETGPALKGKKVIVAEDDAGLRKLMARILAEEGLQVKVAGNGEEALRLLQQNSGKPDLLITDVVMPGMSGGELAQAIRRRYPDIRVIYVSGYTDDVMLRFGIRTNEIDFLAKPFSREELIDRIRSQMDKKYQEEPTV